MLLKIYIREWPRCPFIFQKLSSRQSPAPLHLSESAPQISGSEFLQHCLKLWSSCTTNIQSLSMLNVRDPIFFSKTSLTWGDLLAVRSCWHSQPRRQSRFGGIIAPVQSCLIFIQSRSAARAGAQSFDAKCKFCQDFPQICFLQYLDQK